MRRHFRRMGSDPDYRDNIFTLMRMRGYKSAANKKGQTPWMGSHLSADEEMRHDLPNLRERSRESNRNDPIGAGITGTFVRNIIGTGMRPQGTAKTSKGVSDKVKNDNMEEVFNERKDQLALAEDITYGEYQRMLMTKTLEDGEVIAKMTVRTPEEPLWFEVVEIDRLQDPKGHIQKLENGNYVKDGVERDPSGVPVAYWILKSHPGDSLMQMLKDREAVRIPKESINHLRLNVTRPGQTRAVPALHAVLQDIRDLDLLMVASLKRCQIAACLSVFIKSETDLEDMFEATAEDYGFRLDQSLEPGMIFKLFPNESIETLVPNFPVPELSSFIIMLARRIGAALGVSWQVILKDFSDSTYSSARTDLLESRQVYKILQEWFINKHLNWEWEKVLQNARLRGDPRMRGVTDKDIKSVRWIANGWQWIDPKKEAEATKTKLEVGLTTLRDEAAAQGKDWEDLMRQRLAEEKREMEMRAEMGLPPKVLASSETSESEDEDDQDEERRSQRFKRAA